MAQIRVEVARAIAASPQQVYERLKDYGPSRMEWLPENYSGLEAAGTGVGNTTRVFYTLKVGPRTRTYEMSIEEPNPGSRLVEKDTRSSMMTTWNVEPMSGSARVTVASQWNGAAGVGGFFERLFAPSGLRRVYEKALANLETQVIAKKKNAGG